MKIIKKISSLPKVHKINSVHHYKINPTKSVSECAGHTRKIQSFDFLSFTFFLIGTIRFTPVLAEGLAHSVSPNRASPHQAVALKEWLFQNGVPELVCKVDSFVSGNTDIQSHAMVMAIVGNSAYVADEISGLTKLPETIPSDATFKNSTTLEIVLLSHLFEGSNKSSSLNQMFLDNKI